MTEFQYHRDEKLPIHRLPFVTVNPAADLERRVDFFDVPTTGNYEADNEVGRICAIAFLKYLRSKLNGDPCHLQDLIFSLATETSRKQGVIVGFFWALELWLRKAAADRGQRLDNVAETDLEATVNKILDQHAVTEDELAEMND